MNALLLLALLAADASPAVVEAAPAKPTVWHVLTRDDAGLLPIGWNKDGAIIMQPSTYDLINQEMVRLQKVEQKHAGESLLNVYLAIGISALTCLAVGFTGAIVLHGYGVWR